MQVLKSSTETAFLSIGRKYMSEHNPPDFRKLFEALPGLYLILDPDLRIIAVSNAYAEATKIRREEVLGRGIFDVFPDNPDDPSADGVHHLRASLQQVILHKVPSAMAMQKYDIRKPDDEGGGFEVRYWSPRNSPVLADDGSLQCIIHRVEDVTEFVRLKQQGIEQTEVTQDMRERIERMEAEVYIRAREAIQTSEELRDSQEKLSITLNAIGDAVLVTDAKGYITRLNPVAEQLTGWLQAEALGRPVADIFHIINSETRQQVPVPVMPALVQGTIQELASHTVLVARDGTERAIADSCAPIRNHDGIVIGAILVFRDVTADYAAKAALQQAKEEAEMANRAKDSFLATMSHEIRTPLSGLLGMLELLDLTTLDDDQKNMLHAARNSGAGLLRILSDILDWSKIEEGKLELSIQNISIAKLLTEVINTYSHVASAKGLTLFHQVDTSLRASHAADPLRLSQVLNNFVSNAIKFTARGEVEVSARLVKNIQGAQQIRFSVRDTGIGMTPAEQARLFNRYTQATADTARLYGGTGLGLAISRRLSDLMDGSIDLKSEPGSGSTFSITLVLPTSAAELMDNMPTETSAALLPPIFPDPDTAPTVLLVDDHPINLAVLRRQVSLLGLQGELAEDGEAALALWRNKKIDLIITDCHMPRMDGYSLATTIRNIETENKKNHIPIIAYTANALGEEKQICRDAGMDDVLVKPANMAKLREILLLWLPAITTTLLPVLPQKTDSLTPDKIHEAAIDTAVLSSVVPDQDEQQVLLQKFRLHHRTDHDKLMAEMSGDNSEKIAHMAHRLKGSSRMVGAKELATVYASIEQAAKQNNVDRARADIPALKIAVNRLEEFIAVANKGT